MERQNLILGLQAVSAFGILVIGLLTYFGQSTDDLREEMREGFASNRIEMRGESASIRAEMKEGLAAVRTELKKEFASVQTEMKKEIASVRNEMREGFESVRTEMKDMNTRLARVEGYLGLAKDFSNPTP